MTLIGILVGKFVVALDIAARCAVFVVGVLLIREFWEEPGAGADGLPVQLLIAPLVAYLIWNVWVIIRSSRRWMSESVGGSSFLASLGALSLGRLLWLLPLADDLWWRYRDRLMLLVGVSVAIAILALGEAIRLRVAGADGAVEPELEVG